MRVISLKAARINAGLLQTDVARALRVNRATIGNWESGKHVPPADKMVEMAHLYDVPVDCLSFCTERSL